MKLAIVVGTRPEIIKLCSVVRRAAELDWPTHVIHTGQHYDYEMSEVFFHELQLPTPTRFLEVGSGSHGRQTGDALARVEEALAADRPDLVVVVGDTNSTVAGALAGVKLGVPVAHVEAGVRSFDWTMPEEINRRLVDALATLCFAPTPVALANLVREGRAEASHLVGDTLVEVSIPSVEIAERRASILKDIGLRAGEYALMTLHRSENVDSGFRLRRILEALESFAFPVIYPAHPRALKMLEKFGLRARLEQRTTVLPPLGYLDFLTLLKNARLMLTDSGGVQQESSILRVPCVTLRYNTEWIETVELGHNHLVGVDPDRVVPVVEAILFDPAARAHMLRAPSPFQPGAAARIVSILTDRWLQGRLSIPASDFIRDGLPSVCEKAGPEAVFA